MRRTISAALCCVVSAVSMIPANLNAVTPPFPDMERSWFRYSEAVTYLQKRDVIQGNPDGTFKPKNPVNRAELLKMIFKARSEHDPVVGEQCFPDVSQDAWYAPFVCAAKRRNIVRGYSDGTFKPEQAVNIAEALKMIAQTYGKDIEERGGSKWYEPYTEHFDDDDVFPRHSYLPWQLLTRERAADLLMRVLKHDEDRETLRDSPGCGRVEREINTTITVNGIERSYLLTVPRNYSTREPAPLIIAFHGRTNSNEQVRQYYGLDRRATEYFIAYPAGISNDNGSFSWSSPGDKVSELRDIALFDGIVEQLSDAYCIDMDRIFVVGHSLGAWFANSIACIRGDVVRGSATVGGSVILAQCAGPAAALIINNPKDALSSHSAAEKMRDKRLETNACINEPSPVESTALHCSEYISCDGGNTVMWCPHSIDHDHRGVYYPHVWPSEAAPAIVEFLNDLK